MSTRMPGRAICFDGGPVYDIHVIDVSASGARIEFAPDIELPEEFTLSLPARDEEHIARVRWRRDNTAGVEYMPARSTQTLESVLMRLEAIERRLAGLESAPDEAKGAEESPFLARLADIEERLGAWQEVVAEPSADDGRLRQIEERLAAIETAPAPAPSHDEPDALVLDRLAELEAQLAALRATADAGTDIGDRLIRLEWRLDEMGNDLEALDVRQAREALHRMDERLARLEARVQTPPPAPAPTTDATLVAELSGRIAELEMRMRDGLTRLRALEKRPEPETVMASPAPAPAPTPAPATGSDLAKDVAELKAGVEALVLALSLGLGRAAA